MILHHKRAIVYRDNYNFPLGKKKNVCKKILYKEISIFILLCKLLPSLCIVITKSDGYGDMTTWKQD